MEGADGTPIFRKGGRSLASSHRPSSLTSVIGKMLESITTRNILEHLEKNVAEFSTPGMDSRCVGRSCLTDLLSFFSEVFEVVEKVQIMM